MSQDVLQKLSEKYHAPVEEIRAEMELSINEGYEKHNEAWVRMFGDKRSSIEEFLEAMVQELKK